MARAESQRAADALIEARGIPRQIEMYDYRCLLEIESFAQKVGRDQKIDSFGVTNTTIVRRELRKDVVARDAAAGDARTTRGQRRDARIARQLRPQHRNGLGVLAE